MEKILLSDDLHLFGNRVSTFPIGIKEGFDALIAILPEGLARSYYGISWMEDDEVIYYTMAAEKHPGESRHYTFETKIIIGKGEYLAVTIHNWMNKLDTIKDAFESLMKDNRVAENKPCVEWYKSDDEMVCMMKLR
jgi:hypothetical protein